MTQNAGRCPFCFVFIFDTCGRNESIRTDVRGLFSDFLAGYLQKTKRVTLQETEEEIEEINGRVSRPYDSEVEATPNSSANSDSV